MDDYTPPAVTEIGSLEGLTAQSKEANLNDGNIFNGVVIGQNS